MITREEMIRRYENIIPAVFCAEEAVGGAEVINALKAKHNGDISKVADEYCHLIAVEIVSHTTDAQLAKLNANE